MPTICSSCKEFDSTLSNVHKYSTVFKNTNPNISAKWAKKEGFTNNAPKIAYKRLQNMKLFDQSEGINEIYINLGSKYAYYNVYVWGSRPSKSILCIKDAKKAYGLSYKNVNDAFVQLDENGQSVFNLRQLQIYKDNKKIFPSHIHYKIVSKRNQEQFLSTLYTKIILNDIQLQQLKTFIRQKKAIILNALAPEYYDKHKIPTSHNLYYKIAKKMKTTKINKFIRNLVENYYTPIKSKIKNNVKVYPIVVYCAKRECHAALYLANQLLKHGFIHIYHYPEGINGYFNKKIY